MPAMTTAAAVSTELECENCFLPVSDVGYLTDVTIGRSHLRYCQGCIAEHMKGQRALEANHRAFMQMLADRLGPARVLK